MKCARCRRPLKHPVYVAGMALGSTCAMAVAGAKPKRRQRAGQPKDERQAEMFAEAACKP